MDDLFIDFTNYHIDLKVPKEYVVNCNLVSSNKPDKNYNNYTLIGNNKLDVELNITKNNNFIDFNFNKTSISNFIDTLEVSDAIKTELKAISPSNYTGI